MRRFHFRLEPVLRLRQQLEEQARSALSEAQRHHRSELAREDELRGALQSHGRARAALQRHPSVDLAAVMDADRYAQALRQAIDAQAARVAEASIAVEECRQEFLRRQLDRDALERLRERRQAEHHRDALRAEQQLLDETCLPRRQAE
jgi:flagellar FliJ protein